MMTERVNSGLGAVIMINTNDDTGVIDAIWNEVIRQYHWCRLRRGAAKSSCGERRHDPSVSPGRSY